MCIVNLPYRTCFFELGAGDRGASSCLFSSLCSTVYGIALFGHGHVWEISVCKRRHSCKTCVQLRPHYVHLGTRISVTLSDLPCFVPSYYISEPDTLSQR